MIPLTDKDLETFRGMWWTTGEGEGAYYAIRCRWNATIGIWEAWNAGYGRYPTLREAQEEMKALAISLGEPYRVPGGVLPTPSRTL